MSDATRRVLLDRARTAFAAHGYAGAPIEDVVHAAGLTKGALYHHFGSKQGLFEAVVRDLYEELDTGDALDIVDSDDPWHDLLAGCRTFLEALIDPGIRRILLVDTPAVLGADRERSLDQELTLRPLVAALEALAARGRLRDIDPEALAHVVNGALIAIATWMGDAADPADVLDRGLAALAKLLATIPLRDASTRAPRKPRGAR